MSFIAQNKEATVAEMHKQNPGRFNPIIDRRMVRPPERMVYIYTVARRDEPISHLLFPKLKLRACKNERYVLCSSIPDPIPQIAPDEANGGNRVYDEDAWRAAIDMLNPSNPTIDPYWDNPGSIPAYFSSSQGCNLIAKGFFPSFNNPPTEEEIARAEKSRDDRYRHLTEEAQRLEVVSVRDLNDFIQTQPDVHQAMDALGLEANWHKRHEIKMQCPRCGDSVRQGVAVHQSSAGFMCIIDPLGAYKAGAIKRELYEELSSIDEPEEKRGVGRPRKVQ